MKKDLGIFILRAGFGLMMALGHGLGKLIQLASGIIKFPEVLFLPKEVALVFAVLAEFFAAIAVAIGFKTRLASLPVIITMAVAAFVVHANDAFYG
ncbi:MAG: DoxX family protein [Bacteroidales bacterium]|nr:DoxX family protein [Bacteroidales bacterium]